MLLNNTRLLLSLMFIAIAFSALTSCASQASKSQDSQQGAAGGHANHAHAETFEVHRTEAQWQELLPPKTFEVMRHESTERPFTSPFDRNKEDGVYYCASCGQELFDSKHKFDSGTGWPSYYQPAKKQNVGERKDTQIFMVRTEVHCSRCGGHLGHVFDDGPRPTNLRYCINGAALNFKGRHEAPPKLLK